MKWLLILLALVMVVQSDDVPPRPTAKPVVTSDWDFTNHDKHEQAIVKIVSTKRINDFIDVQVGHGTGFVIEIREDYTFVATAAHVVSDHASLYIKDSVGSDHEAMVAILDKDHDLAVVFCRTHPNMSLALPIAENYPDSPAKVELIGWGFTATDGPRHWEVETVTGSGLRTGTVLNGAVQHGDSGGPILYDGKVIGVMQRGVFIYRGHDSTVVGPGIGCSLIDLQGLAKQTKLREIPF